MAPSPAVKVQMGFSCNKVSVLARHPDSKDSVRQNFTKDLAVTAHKRDLQEMFHSVLQDLDSFIHLLWVLGVGNWCTHFEAKDHKDSF